MKLAFRILIAALWLCILSSAGWAGTAVHVATDGNDSTGDGTIGNPYLTPAKGMTVVAAASSHTLYIKAGTYNTEDGDNDCILWLDKDASAGAITIEGYTTTPGDGGTAIFDAQSSESYCISFDAGTVTGSQYYVICGIDARNGTSDGFNLNNPDKMTFEGCRATGNGGWGWVCDNNVRIADCYTSGNTSGGYDCDQDAQITNSESHDEADGVVVQGGSTVKGCLIEGFTTDGIGANDMVLVENCTIDGQGATAGCDLDACSTVLNTIITSCTTGVAGALGGYENYNIIYDCGTAVSGSEEGGNSLTSDPTFTGSGDYTLQADSPAIDAAMSVSGKTDIGAYEYAAAGGSGGSAPHVVPAGDQGPWVEDATVVFTFATFGSDGASLDSSADGTIHIYKDTTTTQRTDQTGITYTAPFDSVTGFAQVAIDLSDETVAGYYAQGSVYEVVVSAMTLDSVSMTVPVAKFSIVKEMVGPMR